jgi:hypothetical protein
MPIDRPTPGELIAAVREYLQQDLAADLEGQPAFLLRVATNGLAIVERTLSEGDAMDRAEAERIRALLGHDGDLVELNRRLSREIRSGGLDDRRSEVLEHLRQTAADKLRLANPRYRIPRD